MQGGGGNDLYVVDSAGDRVVEVANGGTDTVRSSVTHTLAVNVERLELQGTAAISGIGNGGANTLIGNAAVNALSGGAGADLLQGGGGNDVLLGGGGADTFLFNTALNAVSNVDQIRGFSAQDTIQLENAVFSSLQVGDLAAGAFVLGTAARQADDRIIYNRDTGALSYDADGSGSGAAVQFATLIGRPALSSDDFSVI